MNLPTALLFFSLSLGAGYFLGAWAKEHDSPKSATIAAESVVPHTTYRLPITYSDVIEFNLKDGTRCVQSTRGHLACDWKK